MKRRAPCAKRTGYRLGAHKTLRRRVLRYAWKATDFVAAVRRAVYTVFMPIVLVVDDNEQNLYMLRILLESNGYQVLEASDGEQALETVSRTLPDMVISDILMPVMDGFSLCRRWKADPVLKTRPFVFYTATYTDIGDEEFARSLGADGFLVKPQEPQNLLRVVAELLKAKAPELAENSESETEFLKNYNLTLFHKLEKKVADLEAANEALQRDIALRRALENQLLQSQKMELMGEIASGVVHDFNNVLTAIGGMASLLNDEPFQPEVVKERVARIQEAVRMGATLSRQILAFARQQDLSLALLDLNALLQESLPLIRASLPTSVTVELTNAPGLPWVWADANQLKQVLLNLASNAKDAITPPGQVLVDLALMDLDKEFVQRSPRGRPGQFLRLRFQDSGVGMVPEVLERVFDPFFTTKDSGHGTGLGLSMVYGIVRQHEGFLQVSSVVGRGTCFEIYLPVSSEK